MNVLHDWVNWVQLAIAALLVPALGYAYLLVERIKEGRK